MGKQEAFWLALVVLLLVLLAASGGLSWLLTAVVRVV